MPNLYRVVDGIDVFDSKFNIVSPGCDANLYFPFSDNSKRLTSAQDYISNLFYGDEQANVTVGTLVEQKPIIFSMARLDAVKNLTGLASIFGNSPMLRERCNLVIIGGVCLLTRRAMGPLPPYPRPLPHRLTASPPHRLTKLSRRRQVVNPALTNNKEEVAECQKMHDIINKYQLTTGFRWCAAQTDRSICGEIYRCVADTRGIFVQPALYEAFGLTVIEAMSSGLPTFATSCGGPAEIIHDGVSGFHIDPHCAIEAQAKIEEFFERCIEDHSHWNLFSTQSVQRIESRFTWSQYARRLSSCCAVYSFWAQITSLERHAAKRYLEAWYLMLFRQLVKEMRAKTGLDHS